MAAAMTANEEAQLAQTIEMFEVITQTQPLDYQSLEILKEAYFKLDRQKDVVGTSKRIAQAYVQLGQLSSAILEYESILQRYPDDPDVQAALVEIESKAGNFPGRSSAGEGEGETVMMIAPSRPREMPGPLGVLDDGRAAMEKIFVEGRLISATDFGQCWPEPDIVDTPTTVAEPFIQTLADKGLVPLDRSLKSLCDRARLPYLPLERYDVDVDLARTFPKAVCFRWCVLPFDRMSKSVQVATSNPFNKQAAAELEETTKSALLWYIAPPLELQRALRKLFR